MSKVYWGIVVILLLAGGGYGYQQYQDQQHQSNIITSIAFCLASQKEASEQATEPEQTNTLDIDIGLAKFDQAPETQDNPYAPKARKFCENMFMVANEARAHTADIMQEITSERFVDRSTVKDAKELQWRQDTIKQVKQKAEPLFTLGKDTRARMMKTLSESQLPEYVRRGVFGAFKHVDFSMKNSDQRVLRKSLQSLDNLQKMYEFLYQYRDSYNIKNDKYLFESPALLTRFNAITEAYLSTARQIESIQRTSAQYNGR